MNLTAYFDLLVLTLKVVTTCVLGLIFINYWNEQKMNTKSFQQKEASNTPDTPANHQTEVT